MCKKCLPLAPRTQLSEHVSTTVQAQLLVCFAAISRSRVWNSQHLHRMSVLHPADQEPAISRMVSAVYPCVFLGSQ